MDGRVVALLLLLVSSASANIEFENGRPAAGLAVDFYKKSCPKLDFIVSSVVRSYMQKDFTEVAGLLRLFFHDCFVQGCDASVLLDGTSANPSEKQAGPNATLRKNAFQIVEDIKAKAECVCPGIVSCADIIALATRDSIKVAYGPTIAFPTGRRDSATFASASTTIANLPPPVFNVTQLIQTFAKQGLDVTDMVALSGAHTVGVAHCNSFNSRLRPTVDSTLDPNYAQRLIKICPNSSSTNTANLDEETPLAFDSKYYDLLAIGKGLLNSDQELYFDSRTNPLVSRFRSQTDFYNQFVASMIKMGNIGVLTGSQGQIRKKCSVAKSSVEFSVGTETESSISVM